LPEDHVQDGRCPPSPPTPARRSSEGHRPGPGGSRGLFSPATTSRLVRHGLRPARRGDQPANQPRHGARAPGWASGGWTPAASTSGGARASLICSALRWSSSCSTAHPPARRYEIFKEYTNLVDDQSRRPDDAARACFRIRGVDEATEGHETPPVRVEEVGVGGQHRAALRPPGPCPTAPSQPKPTRKTLAIAMNRLGRPGRTPVRVARDRTRFIPRRQRRPAPLGGQAGGQRAFRRHQRVPGQTPTTLQIKMAQGGQGPARAAQLPRAQGVPVDRQDAVLHAPGRGPDLAAAAPRHLLDRGTWAQLIHDLKKRQPGPPRVHVKLVSEGGRGHGGRGGVQGARPMWC